MSKKLVLLGVGNAALSVRRAAHKYDQVFGTSRSIERLPLLEEALITPILVTAKADALSATDKQNINTIFSGADLLVSYPPDKLADEAYAALAAQCRSIVYISSTGVYGGLTGRIDEVSPVDLEAPSSIARLNAENTWRDRGAVVLRAPGLYSDHSGLISRLKSGTYRLPGDGSNYVSRIHLDDLAKIILAALDSANAKTTYVIGDKRPATHLEVVSYLCEKLQIPVPQAVPLTDVHETLRGNRQICSDKVLKELNVSLTYPSFKEGYARAFI